MINNDITIFRLIIDADFVVKMVILLLVASSIWSWGIIFNKIILLKSILADTIRFEKILCSGQGLSQIFQRVRDKTKNPSALIFIASMKELEKYNLSAVKTRSTLDSIKERIYRIMEIAKSREIEKAESQLGLLATIGSASPFIGLFGTVWGIMHSFQSIASTKNTSLSVVAPGIAEALLATAIGLIAAIPAVIFYNILSTKLNNLSNLLENFVSETYISLCKEIDNGIGKWE